MAIFRNTCLPKSDLAKGIFVASIALFSATSHAYKPDYSDCNKALAATRALNLTGVSIEDKCHSTDILFHVTLDAKRIAFDTQTTSQLTKACEDNRGHLLSDPAKQEGLPENSILTCKVY